MVTVITYGTYDLLHRGHINLLRNMVIIDETIWCHDLDS